MNTAITYCRMATPLGELVVAAADDALIGAWFSDQKYFPAVDAGWREDASPPVLRAAVRQLGEYFSGRRARFDLPLAPRGTPFQQAVWRAIARVRCGETATYGEIAEAAGRAGSARAAGAATGRNPLSIIVPCHRIVGRDGALTGYAGGLPRKRALLELERAQAAGGTRRAA